MSRESSTTPSDTTPVVFIHGHPDTAEVWDDLRARLPDRRTLALKLPGWDATPPEGFDGSRWSLGDWVIEQLAGVGGPVDLVAHDIGGHLTHAVLIGRPELVRSWAIVAGVPVADAMWHEQARIWQTTGLGEQQRDLWAGLERAQRVDVLEGTGLPHADRVVDHLGAEMWAAALSYYRSAVWMGDWEIGEGAEVPPGLVTIGREDALSSRDFVTRLAERTDAAFLDLPGGHWPHLEHPDEFAAALRSLWSGLEA